MNVNYLFLVALQFPSPAGRGSCTSDISLRRFLPGHRCRDRSRRLLGGDAARPLALPGCVNFYQWRADQPVTRWRVEEDTDHPDPALDLPHQAFKQIGRATPPALFARQGMDGQGCLKLREYLHGRLGGALLPTLSHPLGFRQAPLRILELPCASQIPGQCVFGFLRNLGQRMPCTWVTIHVRILFAAYMVFPSKWNSVSQLEAILSKKTMRAFYLLLHQKTWDH